MGATESPGIDETHDPSRQSWVESAHGDPVFPLQNLPFGIVSIGATGYRRGGVAIGDRIFDIRAALDAGLFSGLARQAATAAAQSTLNAFMGLGREARQELRRRLFVLLGTEHADAILAERRRAELLHPAADCSLHLPAAIGAYTDFYAGIQHAINGGSQRNPNRPLHDNYKHVPVAYHSRASSVVASGHLIRRPHGQYQLTPGSAPIFGPTRKLDIELELGLWIGPGNALGEPIPIGRASDHLIGLCMLNDWSARDVQAWESIPLGPFLAKNFATTISPWVVTVEALAPFRRAQRPRPDGDPQPLPYLWDTDDQGQGAFDVTIEALIQTRSMRDSGLLPHRMAVSNLSHLYWTPAQMIAHHSCGGCNLQPGDLFGSGTISAPDASGYGSLRELSDNEARPQQLPSGETRVFADDGDEIILRARAERSGFATIGFGDCTGRVVG
jgi:fumarylacetoacetase